MERPTDERSISLVQLGALLSTLSLAPVLASQEGFDPQKPHETKFSPSDQFEVRKAVANEQRTEITGCIFNGGGTHLLDEFSENCFADEIDPSLKNEASINMGGILNFGNDNLYKNTEFDLNDARHCLELDTTCNPNFNF